ncbi:MAG: helix-turn-helix transcriptional regulator [Oryzihumus sp.]
MMHGDRGTDGSGVAGQPDDPGQGTSRLPREWAAIAEATALLRQRAARAIAGLPPTALTQPVDAGEIRLDRLQMLGRDAHEARAQMLALERLATRSVWTLSPGAADPRGFQAAANARSSARGIDLKVVVDLRALNAPVAAAPGLADLVLVAPVHLQMILIDERAAVLHGPRLGTTPSPSCWLHSDPLVIEAAVDLWGRTVRNAIPLPEDVIVLTDRQRAIAAHLLHGLTDAAIARELGVSVRTVASEVRVLMDASGASTRYQTAMRLFDR